MHLLAGRFVARLLIAVIMAAFALPGCARDPHEAALDHLARGDAYRDEGQFAEAVLEYQTAVQLDPRLGEARMRLGDAYLEIRDVRAALDQYVRAADLLPTDTAVQLKAGGLRLIAGQFEDAKDLADRVLEREPENLQAILLRANALAGVRDLETALAQVREAIQLAPGDSELYTNLGALQTQAGALAEAEAAFRHAIELDPRSAAAHLALGNFYWATRRRPLAEQSFRAAIDHAPTHVLAHRAMATLLMTSGRALEAEPHLQAVADQLDDVESKLQLADYYLLTDQREAGIATLEAVAALPDGRDRARTRLAAAYYAQGRVDDAHGLIDEVLASSPDEPSALVLKARFLSEEGRDSDAIDMARRAVEADPAMTGAHQLEGDLLLARGDLSGAQASFERVLDLNPLASAAQTQLSQIHLARGEGSSSLQFAETAVSNAPGNPAARITLIRALLERNDLARADAELDVLRQRTADAPIVDTLHGSLEMKRGNLTAARAALERARQKDPTLLEPLSGLLALDLATGDTAGARRRLEQALQSAPDRVELLMLAAGMYRAMQEHDRAETLLRQAVAGEAGTLAPYQMLGQLYYEQGRLDEGQREFEALVGRNPRAVWGHIMLGLIYRRQGRIPDAVSHYEQALALDPESGVAANNLAWLFALEKTNLSRALDLARLAKRRLPDQAEVSDTVGWVYHVTGSSASAIGYLQESVDRAPRNPLYRYHLGAAYLATGDFNQARTHLEEALSLAPQFAESSEVRRLLATIQ